MEAVQGTHLLKGLVKDDFPKARILSFGYDSGWLFNATYTTSSQIGNKLLAELSIHYLPVRTTKPSKRRC
jgi:hypothetical protein